MIFFCAAKRAFAVQGSWLTRSREMLTHCLTHSSKINFENPFPSVMLSDVVIWHLHVYVFKILRDIQCGGTLRKMTPEGALTRLPLSARLNGDCGCNCPLGRIRASVSPPSVSSCHCPSRNRRRAIRPCESRNIHVRRVPEVAPPCSAYSTLASPERFVANILNLPINLAPIFRRKSV